MTGVALIVVAFLINTYNEEANLANALASVVTWCDEIIVVDMYSTDKTVEIAKSFDAKVSYHDHTGFSEPARKQDISKATGDWLLVLDADELNQQNHHQANCRGTG